MRELRMNQKMILALLLLLSFIASTTVTIISHNDLSDGISITLSIMAVIGMIAIMATVFLEIIKSICNP